MHKFLLEYCRVSKPSQHACNGDFETSRFWHFARYDHISKSVLKFIYSVDPLLPLAKFGVNYFPSADVVFILK